MKRFVTLMLIIISTAFSQAVISTHKFNSTDQGGPDNSTSNGWSLKSSNNCFAMTGEVILKQQNIMYAGNNSISINNLDHLQLDRYVLQMEIMNEMLSV